MPQDPSGSRASLSWISQTSSQKTTIPKVFLSAKWPWQLSEFRRSKDSVIHCPQNPTWYIFSSLLPHRNLSSNIFYQRWIGLSETEKRGMMHHIFSSQSFLSALFQVVGQFCGSCLLSPWTYQLYSYSISLLVASQLWFSAVISASRRCGPAHRTQGQRLPSWGGLRSNVHPLSYLISSFYCWAEWTASICWMLAGVFP